MDEVAVQRVADALLDRLVGGEEGLGDHLAAVDPPDAAGGADAAEQVDLQPFELERLAKVEVRHG